MNQVTFSGLLCPNKHNAPVEDCGTENILHMDKNGYLICPIHGRIKQQDFDKLQPRSVTIKAHASVTFVKPTKRSSWIQIEAAKEEYTNSEISKMPMKTELCKPRMWN